jgi:hypothetical protein
LWFVPGAEQSLGPAAAAAVVVLRS